jgi:hypothetical protein
VAVFACRAASSAHSPSHVLAASFSVTAVSAVVAAAVVSALFSSSCQVRSSSPFTLTNRSETGIEAAAALTSAVEPSVFEDSIGGRERKSPPAVNSQVPKA